MKRLLLLSFVAMMAGKLIAQQNIQSIAIGTKAPSTEVSMLDVSGKKISLNQAMQANGVLIMFSCNTCPYVIKNQERTKTIAAFAKNNNIGFVAINSNEAQRNDVDSYKAMQDYAKQQQYNFSYVVDTDATIANAFGATKTPELFLIDKNGIVVYKGAIDDNPTDAKNVKQIFAREAMLDILENKPVTTKESKSIGCSIKRKS